METIQSLKQKHIFLIGFMGAGKSTIAKALQEMLNCTVVEMDARIEMEENRSISQIFAEEGEAYFRQKETNLLRQIGTEETAIISCGGGVAMREENRAIMKQIGYTVLLTARPETIFERVRYSQKRPILNQNMSVSYIKELMEKRKDAYEVAADIVVWTDEKQATEICDEILQKLSLLEEL